MKQINLIILLLACFAGKSFGQQNAAAKVVISTPTVQCELCKDRLENYLKREPGVTAVKVDVKKKITAVSYLKDRNNIEHIKTAIANAGFDADDITAEEDAVRKLPICCKKSITQPNKATQH